MWPCLKYKTVAVGSEGLDLVDCWQKIADGLSYQCESLFLVCKYCFGEHFIFSAGLVSLCFPPGLPVEISDGECSRGHGSDGGLQDACGRIKFELSIPDPPEEAACCPQTAHALRGGARGTLQCGAGEWIHIYCIHNTNVSYKFYVHLVLKILLTCHDKPYIYI